MIARSKSTHEDPSMATTALFVELLVVGLQAEAWLILLTVTLLGPFPMPWDRLEKWTALLTIVAVGVAYVLGIIVDRLADVVTEFALRPGDRQTQSVPRMRLRVMKESEALAAFLDYQRSRVRIARGTVANLALGGPVLLLFLASKTDADATDLGTVALLVLGMLAAAVIGARSIQRAYLKRLKDSYELVTEASNGAARVDVAAAVCVRQHGGPQVLLVRTKGKQWIFPKGRAEAGDADLSATAMRELLEEAGATGSIEPTPFTTFRYRKQGGDQQIVSAFVVRDAELVSPGEKFRKPEWFTRDEAATRLRERRPDAESAELVRVVVEALTRGTEHVASPEIA
jgi:8-oxo-dGTP pyrophosphatase MutT (NUDIX family)